MRGRLHQKLLCWRAIASSPVLWLLIKWARLKLYSILDAIFNNSLREHTMHNISQDFVMVWHRWISLTVTEEFPRPWLKIVASMPSPVNAQVKSFQQSPKRWFCTAAEECFYWNRLSSESSPLCTFLVRFLGFHRTRDLQYSLSILLGLIVVHSRRSWSSSGPILIP